MVINYWTMVLERLCQLSFLLPANELFVEIDPFCYLPIFRRKGLCPDSLETTP
jgi:hypothetical protein